MRPYALLLPLLATSALHAATPFVPDDPYFLPGIRPGTTENYAGQWHLENHLPVSATNVGYDSRVRGAWDRGLTGRGVIIGIVDGAGQGFHPDLEFNADGSRKFHNEYSWGFYQTAAENLTSSYRGSVPPRLDQVDFVAHGISSAGVALAAGGNGVGVTGVAPNAGYASIQADDYLDGPYSGSQVLAAAILYQGQTRDGVSDPFSPVDWGSFAPGGAPIKVKNMSLGATFAFDRTSMMGASSAVSEALAEIARNGVIYVASAGNSRGTSGINDANKSFIPTSARVITVAAVASHGRYSSYSSAGSNVFVSALSGNADRTHPRIATTDPIGPAGYNNELENHFSDLDYNDIFDGTSSAAPLVAGIMALGVEASGGKMDARMAQHLLVRTSRKIDEADASTGGGWITNAVGHHFNRNYGFGLIDADAFTSMATQVAELSPEVVYTTTAAAPVTNRFEVGTETLSYTESVSYTDALPVEYVRVSLLLTDLQEDFTAYTDGVGSILGDFSATLTSAEGTTFTLFIDDRDTRERNEELTSSLEWTFTSFAYWGEEINGDWTLNLTNHSTNLGTALNGVWESVSFEFGTGEIVLIPEPSAFLLFSTALGLGLIRRSRQKKSNATARNTGSKIGMA